MIIQETHTNKMVIEKHESKDDSRIAFKLMGTYLIIYPKKHIVIVQRDNDSAKVIQFFGASVCINQSQFISTCEMFAMAQSDKHEIFTGFHLMNKKLASQITGLKFDSYPLPIERFVHIYKGYGIWRLGKVHYSYSNQGYDTWNFDIKSEKDDTIGLCLAQARMKKHIPMHIFRLIEVLPDDIIDMVNEAYKG